MCLFLALKAKFLQSTCSQKASKSVPKGKYSRKVIISHQILKSQPQQKFLLRFIAFSSLERLQLYSLLPSRGNRVTMFKDTAAPPGSNSHPSASKCTLTTVVFQWSGSQILNQRIIYPAVLKTDGIRAGLPLYARVHFCDRS